MSAPSPAIRDSEDIGYGFLVAKAAAALRQVPRQTPVSSDDAAVLTEASQFLNDVANGARISAGEILEGVSPSRSIAALNVAFGPLEVLKQLVGSEAEIAPIFQSLSRAVGLLALEPAMANEVQLKAAEQFFSAVGDWLLCELSARARCGAVQ